MRRPALLALAAVLAVHSAFGQRAPKPAAPVPAAAPAPAAPAAPPVAKETWAFSASAYTYLVPDDSNYVQPTFTADRGRLHLEARYNYEARDSGSVWLGANFGGGEKLAWEFTPMLGGVLGDTSGVAPGYKGSLAWGMLELYSEGEYLFDSNGSADSYFYSWSELTLAPLEWLRFGLLTQRTRAYQSDRELQRGLLVGCSFERLSLTAYVLNPDVDKPTWVLAVGFEF